jgi:hypothetical protein
MVVDGDIHIAVIAPAVTAIAHTTSNAAD